MADEYVAEFETCPVCGDWTELHFAFDSPYFIRHADIRRRFGKWPLPPCEMSERGPGEYRGRLNSPPYPHIVVSGR